MKSLKAYLMLLGLLFAGYVALEYNRPKPLDWSPTLSNKDKIPYGTFVLYDLLPELLNAEVKNVRLPVYNQLNAGFDVNSNYLFINKNFTATKEDLEILLAFTEEGGQVFIAAESFEPTLLDTLGLHVQASGFKLKDTTTIALTGNYAAKTGKIKLHSGAGIFFLQPIDSLIPEAVILDTLAVNSTRQPVLLRRSFGKGNFYLCTVPMLFTNYYLLRHDNTALAASYMLGNLPQQLTLWDEYQKQGRVGEQTLLRVVLSYDALRWAYYLALTGLVLFMVFESKRRQQVIPVVEPPANTTLEFTEAVASLYYKSHNHKLLAEKKILYLYEFLRQHLYMPTNLPPDEMKEHLLAKTDLTRGEAEDLFRTIEQVQNAASITEHELHILNNAIEKVYRRTKAAKPTKAEKE